MSRPSCFNQHNQHIGPLEEIDLFCVGEDEYRTIKWCAECGAVVVDHDIDGRSFPTTNMRFPKITIEGLKHV